MENEDTPTIREHMDAKVEVPRIAVAEIAKPIIMGLPELLKTGAVLVTPPNYSVTDLKRYFDQHQEAQPTPPRRRGTYIAADIDSLLSWMTAHCDEEAPVFAVGAEHLAATWTKPNLALVGIGNYSHREDARWHDFVGLYRFPVTLAWTQWSENNGEWMSQGEFSEFVEKHLYEFSEPMAKEKLPESCTRMIEALGGTKSVGTPGKMYEVSNGIKIMVSEQVEVELDRATGEQTLKFSEAHTGKGGRPVAIPKFFFIRLPIFFGEDASLVGVLLRYRNKGGGRVEWSYELFAPDLTVKDAFDKACEVVRTVRTLYMGTPDRPNAFVSDTLALHY
ncbi:MAG TPA: DUF2303 family protein [Acidobacteriaceae bacterium]|jgi:hypothetical protein